MPIVTLQGIQKAYNGRLLFSDVDLTIEPGTAIGIQGENGSGKSVMLRIMTRLALPDAGTLSIDERFLSKDRVFPESFGILIDRPGYIPSLTGLQNLMSLARIRNQVDEAHVRLIMEEFGLNPDLPQKARHYSLGMKQRLGLAQAVMEHQQVLVLDEPFNALDEETSKEMRSRFRIMVENGRTLVMTSHNREDFDAVCSEVYQIRRERLERVK